MLKRGNVHVGTNRSRLRTLFPHATTLGSPNRLRLSRYVIAGLRHGRVSYLAVYDRRAIRTTRRLLTDLRRAA